MKRLWVSFLWSILVPKSGLTFLNIWNLHRHFHLENNIKTSCYLTRIPVDLRFIYLSHSVILCWCHCFPSYLPLQLLTPPLYIGMLFPHVFLFFFCLFHLTLIWCFYYFFNYFFTTCKTSSIKIWFLLATGLTDKTQVVFRRPFVIQHVRTRLLNCETWNFRCFYICIDMKSICDLWCYCICSCCIRVISWFESQKCMNKPYTITLTPKGYTRLTANKIIRS